MAAKGIVERLEQQQVVREREKRESRSVLARADRTRRAVHREAVELLTLLDGPSFAAEMEGIEQAFRRARE